MASTAVRIAFATVLAILPLIALATLVEADGTCADHKYRVYRGEPGYSSSHDRDGDGVGCESNPEPPNRTEPTTPPPSDESSDSGSTSTDYDRDNWDFDSSAARARLGCSSSEHVDHIVALKEAYDSGASSWSNTRKSTFANDPQNQWCLDASLNASKSDRDLAEWSGGSCEQRKHIATVTIAVKAKYGLTTDPAENTANQIALNATCSTSAPDDQQESASADVPATLELRITARLLADGRIEFAVRLEDGTRVSPRARFFPRNARIDRWLVSSPVQVDGADVGRIRARRVENGRTEFGFITNSGTIIVPRARFLPVSPRIDHWLVSSPFGVDESKAD